MARKNSKRENRIGEAVSAPKPLRPATLALVDLWTCAALAAAVFAVYSTVAGHTFLLLDDPDYVPKNPRVTAGITASGIGWALASFHAGNWFPLTWISLMLDCELFGVNPGASASINELLHALNSVLLFVVLKRATSTNPRGSIRVSLLRIGI